ncbi:MAG: diguanylate cyclase domain-containing protein [Clostridium sp.]|uniref:diguanylate cyclase domain-containing protein n=1 Tax=Clostridium sp. TaxID=1506 RepID=UPI003F348093
MMEKFDVRKRVDIAMTIIIVFFFGLGLTFSMFNFKSSYENYVMFLLLMIVCIVSYYLGVTMSLVVTLVVDFGYISFKIYDFFMDGVLANVETYYWIILIVVGAIVSSYLSKNINVMQEEVKELTEKNNELVMIDSESGIRNIKAFINEMPIYMSMVNRHRDLPLSLMVMQIKHSGNIRKILGVDKYKVLINTIAKITNETLRDEDRKYVLSNDTFAYILITDEKGSQRVKERIKESINKEIDLKRESLRGIKIEIQMGICEWKETIKDPVEFLTLAESELNYDV